jgi:hypothetical protein
LRRHLSYLKYVIRHKWFVWQASRKIGAPLWQALMHDLSKFRPSEWTPYACTFYKSDGSKQYDETPEFNRAWLLHQHRNPHHWQHWLLRMDKGDVFAVEMPRLDALEMVADWMGAGRARTGKWECAEWYAKNRDKIILHDKTRRLVDGILFVDNALSDRAAAANTVKPVVQPWIGKLHHARQLSDDWGYIRDETDNLIIRINLPTHDETVLAEHRRNKTDPTQERVDAILAALNMSSKAT